ncbi:unnamed protein product [Symbiodinium sp. CCMP2592]|nr:unnamed protein product [Symbiodinium sp. CCMP2592]
MAPEFVRYNCDHEIIDVDEFQVARAIFRGETQALSQEVFDLCVTFGHHSTAAALAKHGACSLEAWHLGPFARWKVRQKRTRVICGCVGSIRSTETCDFCCWGSETERGEWMLDWDAELGEAVASAREAAERPVTRLVLAMLRSGEEFDNLHISESAMARLLDIAVLTGDSDLAQRCAAQCVRRPLRRWRSEDFFVQPRTELIAVASPDVFMAAILAGIALQGLLVGVPSLFGLFCPGVIPLRGAVAMCGDLQLWRTLAPLLPESQHPWSPSPGKPESGLLLCRQSAHYRSWELCVNRLRTALLANIDLKRFGFYDGYAYAWRHCCPACAARVGFLDGLNVGDDRRRLLDVAVCKGQSECAELLASREASASCWLRELCLPDMLCAECGDVTVPGVAHAPLEQRRATAGAALRAALTRSRKLVAPMGFVVYQAMLRWGCGKKVPPPLVNHVLSFAAKRPTIAKLLEGLEDELLHAADSAAGSEVQEQSRQPEISPTMEEGPELQSVQPAGSEVEEPSQQPEISATTPDMGEQAEPVAEKSEEGPDAKSTDDVLVALRNSKAQAQEVPLSSDGVMHFRLTRKAHAPHVNELLLDPTGPLAVLHRRVLEAGCEVAPDWSPVKALFVPCTVAQMQELLASAEEGGVHPPELGKEHILALRSDFPVLDRAIRSISKKYRPRLRPTLREEPQSESDDEPFIVAEGGLRTDSSLGFPSYDP